MSITDDKLYFKKIGHGPNVLIMLHAFPVNHQLFEKAAQEMINEDWTLITPDFPGFGNTPEDKSRKIMTMETLARLVKEIMPIKKESKIVLGGVSMGGYVAMAFEKRFPQEIDAYIFSNTNDGADGDGGQGRKDVVEIIDQGNRQDWLKNEFIPKALGKTTFESRPHIINQCWAMFDQSTDLAIKQTMLGMGKRTESREVLKNLNVPILVISGDEDRITGPDIAQEMTDTYKQSELQIIPKAGHFAVLERPHEYARIIRSYLNSL